MTAATARTISAGSRSSSASPEMLQLVTFHVGQQEYAVPLLLVQEINRLLPINRVPHCADYIEGVIHLRGRCVPVMNLHQRLALDTAASRTNECRLMVIAIAGRSIGLVIDAVNEVVRIRKDDVDPAPPLDMQPATEYMQGSGRLDERLFMLMDLDRLFDDATLSQLDQAVRHTRNENAAA